MSRPSRHPNRFRRSHHAHRRSRAKSPAVKFKPGADKKLKRVFAGIGVPEKTPFHADPFQREALRQIKTSDCLVTAPTGAGKTWIAVQAIQRLREQGQRAWYASPLKALSNAKYHEFGEIFGATDVGILTGDRKENPDAPIIIGTTEILRNQLYDAMHRGEDLATDFVILDEAHYLGDQDRGVVWEEIMIYLPARIPILMLSATIGNARHVAEWLTSIRHKPCAVVAEKHRPVPLYPLFLHPSGTLLPLLTGRDSKGRRRLYGKVRELTNQKRAPRLAPPHRLPPFGDILRLLRKYNLLPAIFFLKSRADCDSALDLCRDSVQRDAQRQEALSRRLESLVRQSPHIARHRQLWQLEHLAVGAHHSGQLPAWKLCLETLMNEALLDAVFATSTVAAGVNFPARTVVFFNSDRFNGREFVALDATQFHQMTGRAGRRGMDHIGFAVAVPGKFMDIRHIQRLITTPASPVISQIRINFSMTLNLLLSHSPAQIEALLDRSFATYLILKVRKKSQGWLHRVDRKYLWKDFTRHLNFLKQSGYVSADGQLTEDGLWASRLRVDQPLIIAEGFRRSLFPGDDPILMAALVASFVNEEETDEHIPKGDLPRKLREIFFELKQGLEPFVRRMRSKGFPVRPLFLRPAAAIYAWAAGQPWERIITLSELPEGDLSMLILRTADNLRHIEALASVFPAAAASARNAIELILRDPVLTEFELWR
jgi:superfamily II RNA helicase